MSSSHLISSDLPPPPFCCSCFPFVRETFTPKECGNSTCGTSSVPTQLFRWKVSKASMMRLGMKSLRFSKSMSVVLPGTMAPTFFLLTVFFARFFLLFFCLALKTMMKHGLATVVFHGSQVLGFNSFWGSSSFVLILFGANHLPTLLRAFARTIYISSKNAHPLLICSWVRRAQFSFSCFFRWWNMTYWLSFSLVFKSLIERSTAPVFHLEGVLPWWHYIHSSGNKKQWTWISYPKNHGISKLVVWRCQRTLRHSRVKPLYWEGASWFLG